jgi:hypothetical protein
MLQWDGEVMMVMMVLVMMMMMMIPMKPSSMTVTMSTIFTSGREFPRQISACRRALSLAVFRPAEAVEYFSDGSPNHRFREDDIRKGALAEVDQGSHTTWLRGDVSQD